MCLTRQGSDRQTNAYTTSMASLSTNYSALLEERWINEYLTVSQRVYKWKHPQRNVQVGDVVIMVEDDMKSTQWPIGRVEVVYPGKDGRVRVARIKNSKGSYTRPIAKLIVLDCSE